MLTLASIANYQNVGSYVFATSVSTGSLSVGATASGSNLHLAGFEHPSNSGFSQDNVNIFVSNTDVMSGGTWRFHGVTGSSNNASGRYSMGLWQRIS